MIIAGHEFQVTPWGRICSCGRRWIEICNVGPEAIGKTDIAHTGNLTQFEYDAIRTEVERIWTELVCVVTA